MIYRTRFHRYLYSRKMFLCSIFLMGTLAESLFILLHGVFEPGKSSLNIPLFYPAFLLLAAFIYVIFMAFYEIACYFSKEKESEKRREFETLQIARIEERRIYRKEKARAEALLRQYQCQNLSKEDTPSSLRGCQDQSFFERLILQSLEYDLTTGGNLQLSGIIFWEGQGQDGVLPFQNSQGQDGVLPFQHNQDQDGVLPFQNSQDQDGALPFQNSQNQDGAFHSGHSHCQSGVIHFIVKTEQGRKIGEAHWSYSSLSESTSFSCLAFINLVDGLESTQGILVKPEHFSAPFVV